MNAGRVEQVGTPAQVFEEPASPFVMRFLGAVNVFRGRVDGGRAYVGDLEFSAPEGGGRAPAHVYVRPHELEIGQFAVPGSFAARVERVVPLGAAVRVELSAGPYGERLEAEVDLRRSQALSLAPGDSVHLSPRRVRVFAGPAIDQDSLTASQL
jgi:sulfate transport system ATP-binding protein